MVTNLSHYTGVHYQRSRQYLLSQTSPSVLKHKEKCNWWALTNTQSIILPAGREHKKKKHKLSSFTKEAIKNYGVSLTVKCGRHWFISLDEDEATPACTTKSNESLNLRVKSIQSPIQLDFYHLLRISFSNYQLMIYATVFSSICQI